MHVRQTEKTLAFQKITNGTKNADENPCCSARSSKRETEQALDDCTQVSKMHILKKKDATKNLIT